MKVGASPDYQTLERGPYGDGRVVQRSGRRRASAMADVSSAIEAFAKVIAAAAVSSLGILALLILVVGWLAHRFFKDVHVAVRFVIFMIMFSGAAAFGAAVMAAHNPVLAEIRTAPKMDPARPDSEIDGSEEPAASGVDAACLEERLKELQAAQEFSQDGGVGCESAGISGKGKSKNSAVTFRAPPGFSIVGAVRVSEISNIDGSYGAVQYVRSGDAVVEAHVPVSCRSESKIFGPGASMRIRLSGVIEKAITEEQRMAAMAACSQ